MQFLKEMKEEFRLQARSANMHLYLISYMSIRRNAICSYDINVENKRKKVFQNLYNYICDLQYSVNGLKEKCDE